jgi:hypothetical protein
MDGNMNEIELEAYLKQIQAKDEVFVFDFCYVEAFWIVK